MENAQAAPSHEGRPSNHFGTTEPFARTAGSSPAIGSLIEMLEREGFAPWNESSGGQGQDGGPARTVGEFKTLLSSALLVGDSETRNRAWAGIFEFIDQGKHTKPSEQWVGLEEFMARVREWQVGKTLDEICLVFNADEIMVNEWFQAFITSAHMEVGSQIAKDSEGLPHRSALPETLVFDLDHVTAADLYSNDFQGEFKGWAALQATEPSAPVCKVYDLDDVSFLHSLQSSEAMLGLRRA